jgi:hypothetical protein
MEERVKVSIGLDGSAKVETLEGFVGTACAKETEKIMQMLGGTVIESGKKPEYYDEGDNPVEILSK